MTDLTEQQEQEMIDRAKAGDPEANYQMSLWALEQSIAEPEEERWNRLAAKCLVKAAEAGYEPAKQKMNELLAQSAGEADAAPQEAPAAAPVRPAAQEPAAAQGTPVSQSAPAAQSASTPSAPDASAVREKAAAFGSAVAAGAGAAFTKVKGLFAKSGAAAGTADAAGASDGKKAGFLNFSQWDDAKWKKMQVVCIVICAVLLILLLILLLTGRNKKKNAEETAVVPTPVAEIVVTPEPVSTPEPAAYPDEATRAEIAAADLEVFPADDDFVDAAKTVTVSTSGSVLNLRRGAGQSYGQVGSMPNGTTADVYAYKNGWALVKYNGVWGWCSNEYLK